MKLRNQLLAIACLLVFAGIGYLYVRTWVVQKPFGVILFVSDGLASSELTAARIFEGGADHRLSIEAFPHLALLRNFAEDFAVPDDAAAASALATGVRGHRRALSVDAGGKALQSITQIAREQGRAIGIVTNGSLAGPTTGAFYAHTADAGDSASIAVQLLEKFRPEVALGGGANDFLPRARLGLRQDGRDLLGEFQAKGCKIVRTKAELEDSEAFQEDGILGLFAPGPLAFSTNIESGSQQPSLSDLVRRAIVFLQQSSKGYLLVVDASLVGKAAENNEGERALAEIAALDRAIATARDYAGDKSLIIAAGSHGIGGMSLNSSPSGSPLRQDRGVALLGSSADGYPYLTWATGPNGPPPTSQALPPAPGDPNARPSQKPAPGAKSQPAAVQTPYALNSADDMIAVGRGAGAEKLTGFLDSVAIFSILRDAL